MRVLVTGGAGFVGSHVVEALLRSGDEPAVLDDLSTGSAANLPAGVPLLVADIADGSAVARACTGVRFDAVVHCAAKTKVVDSVANPELYRRVVVSGTKNVLATATETGAHTFVNISTGGAMYGETPTCANEGTPARPLSPYGAFKLMAEDFVSMSALMRTVTLRFANVFGPRQRGDLEGGVVSIFVDRWSAAEGITVFGDGTAERDYVYATDCANAVLNALRQPVRGIFNVGTGVATSVNALIDEISTFLGPPRSVRYVAARPGELQRSCLDPSKARRLGVLGSTTTLPEGLRLTIEPADRFRVDNGLNPNARSLIAEGAIVVARQPGSS